MPEEEKCRELEEKAINYRVEMMRIMIDALPVQEQFPELLEKFDSASSKEEKEEIAENLEFVLRNISKKELQMLQLRDEVLTNLPEFEVCGIPLDFLEGSIQISKNANGNEVWVSSPKKQKERVKENE